MFAFLVSALVAVQILPAKDLPPMPEPNAVAMVVNGRAFTVREITTYLWDWRAQEVEQEILGFTLIEQEAAKRKVTITDAEVESAVKEQLAQISKDLAPGQTLEENLRERGVPRSRLFLRFRSDMLLGKLAEQSFHPQEFVKASTLAVKPKSEAAIDVANAITAAQKAYDRLKKGEPWSTVLRSVTSDPALLKADGMLDWVPLDAFPASTRTELAKLPAGGFTTPVQTPNGIQVFRVDALGKGLSGAELDTLKSRALPKLRQAMFNRLRSEAKIEGYGIGSLSR